MHFVEQKYKLLIKTKRNRKWKIPHTILDRRTLCFSSYENHELKVKLWCFQRKFFNICVFSWCLLYWIHFQNIHTFTYQKTLLHTLFCLFSKSPKAFNVSLMLQYLDIEEVIYNLRHQNSFKIPRVNWI